MASGYRTNAAELLGVTAIGAQERLRVMLT
jgi:hypothetical protein